MKIDRKPFDGDLTDGELWEYYAARAVSRELGYLFGFSNNKSHDVEFFERPMGIMPETVEVKVDFMAKRTGNIYLEVENTRQGISSGIMGTKAKLWLHAVPHLNKVYVFQPPDMIKHLEENKGVYRVVDGGDENSRGPLIPIQTLEQLQFVHVILINKGGELYEAI